MPDLEPRVRALEDWRIMHTATHLSEDQNVKERLNSHGETIGWLRKKVNDVLVRIGEMKVRIGFVIAIGGTIGGLIGGMAAALLISSLKK